jgi:hypothetical protein
MRLERGRRSSGGYRFRSLSITKICSDIEVRVYVWHAPVPVVKECTSILPPTRAYYRLVSALTVNHEVLASMLSNQQERVCCDMLYNALYSLACLFMRAGGANAILPQYRFHNELVFILTSRIHQDKKKPWAEKLFGVRRFM